MKVSSIETATIVRDASIEAMDALNAIVEEVAPTLGPEDAKELRRAVGRALTGVLENLVNPVLRAYPELDVEEDLWGAIAVERSRARLGRS